MGIETVLHQRKIRQLDLSPVVTVESSSTLGNTLEAMRSAKRGAALVIENGMLAGIFTERDLITKVVGTDIDESCPIRQFMTAVPATLSQEASVFDAVQLMDEHGYRNIPIVDDSGRLLGSLPVSKIVDFLAEIYPQEVLALPPRAEQQFTAADGA
jgi:CBS domain-containing protein